MTLRTLISPLLASALLALAACNDNADNPNAVPADACYDFATLITSGPSGSEFQMQKGPDTPVITYTARQTFSPDSLQTYNMRMIILYSPKDDALPYTSGPINLYGYRLTDNQYQTAMPDTASRRDTAPVKMQSIARTGEWVNMQMQLRCMRTSTPKDLALVYAPGAENDSVPELHLVYVPATDGDNFMTGYASFSLNPMWQTAKAVTISWDSPEGKLSHTFKKEQ